MARVLVADDEEAILSLVRRVLEQAGHEVVTVSDGHEALKRALKEDFDLYVLDVRMPHLDGYSLSNSITKRFPHRKIVLITALDRVKYEAMINLSGATATISKPFDGTQFLGEIKKFLP